MDITDRKAREIYSNFGSEKVICSVKDKDLSINMMKSIVWVYPLMIFLLFLILLIIYKNLDTRQTVIFIISAILSILWYLYEKSTLYFDENELILENRLGKRTSIDISKYPRIYVKCEKHRHYNKYNRMHETYETYDLYIEQKNVQIHFDIKSVGAEKISLLLNNLNTKNKYEISEEKWRESENEYDSKTTDLINFFEGRERIIGVKDPNQKIKISKSSSIIFWFLLIVFMLCMILSIYLAIIKEFLFVGFVGLFDIILLGVVIAEWKSLAMRISFPNEGKIKIDGKVFDYKHSDVSIFIDRYINNSGLTKYDNELVIASRDKIYNVNVELLDEKKLNQFISNLVFQNR